jgi:hypothetical protein
MEFDKYFHKETDQTYLQNQDDLQRRGPREREGVK